MADLGRGWARGCCSRNCSRTRQYPAFGSKRWTLPAPPVASADVDDESGSTTDEMIYDWS